MATEAVDPHTGVRHYPLRRVLVLVAAFAAVVVSYGQMASGLGQSPAEFAADSDETLRVAGYAFSIWGVIYAGLLVYAVYQALPQTLESPLLRRLGWPSFLALSGIALWIVAAAADAETATVILIFGSAAALLVPLLGGYRITLSASRRQRWLIAWPLALLAGWLTIASVVNLITVLSGNGALPGGLSPLGWALVGVAFVTAMAVGVVWRTGLWIYALPIAWGLIGVFAAEYGEGDRLLAFSGLAAAFAVALVSLALTLRRGSIA